MAENCVSMTILVSLVSLGALAVAWVVLSKRLTPEHRKARHHLHVGARIKLQDGNAGVIAEVHTAPYTFVKRYGVRVEGEKELRYVASYDVDKAPTLPRLYRTEESSEDAAAVDSTETKGKR